MENIKKTGKNVNVRWLVFTALMAAMSVVLSEVPKFEVPVMPKFVSFEFSDVPAMLAALTMGPVSGVFVCLVKNVFGCFTSSTGCVGELSNFILGVALVLPAGFITHKSEKISRAVIGCVTGSVLMALISIASNYFLVFPAYSVVYNMPIEGIVGLYKAILPSVDSLLDCLIIFHVPFTFAKGFIAAVISIILYKRLRPIFNSIYRE